MSGLSQDESLRPLSGQTDILLTEQDSDLVGQKKTQPVVVRVLDGVATVHLDDSGVEEHWLSQFEREEVREGSENGGVSDRGVERSGHALERHPI